MNFKLKGKIDHAEFYNGSHMIYVTTPAADAYSQPNSFKLRSHTELGAVGQEISCTVAISGFIRKKPYQDKNTGQQKIYREDNVFFDVVPSSK